MHAHQVQEEVAAEVAADDVSAAVFHEKHDRLVHLVVCYEAEEKRGKFRRKVYDTI